MDRLMKLPEPIASEQSSPGREALTHDIRKRVLSASRIPATWLQSCVRLARRRRKDRQTLRALEALNDHHLMDVGIERSHIPFVVADTPDPDQ